MLPIVQRELRVAARNPKLYRRRLSFGLLSVLVVGGMVSWTLIGRGGGGGGAGIFSSMALLAWWFCVIEGIRKTADCISEEKREGTLGFLFLTELGGLDIVFGKLAGALLRSLSGLLVFAPILATTLLVGGVMPGEFWRMFLGLVSVLTFSLSVGILVSTFTRTRSLGLTFGILAGLTIIPMMGAMIWAETDPAANVAWLKALSPLTAYLESFDARYGRSPQDYWWSIAMLQGLSWLAMLAAGGWLKRVWRDMATVTVEAVRHRGVQWPGTRAALLDRNPFLWVAWHPRDSAFFQSIFWLGTAFYLVCRIFISGSWLHPSPIEMDIVYLVLASIFFALYLSSQATVALAESKRSGALELVLSTPMTVEEIIAGQKAALWKMFGAPFIFLAAGCFYVLAFFIVRTKLASLGTIFLAQYPIAFIVTCATVVYAGIWMALKCRTPNRAFLATFGLCVVLPYFVSCVPVLLTLCVLYVVCRRKAVKQFRLLMAERYGQSSDYVLAVPSFAAPNAPPVLR